MLQRGLCLCPRKLLLQDARTLQGRVLSIVWTSTSQVLLGDQYRDAQSPACVNHFPIRHFRTASASSVASEEGPQQTTVSTARNESNSIDFPGGRVPFTDRLCFIGGALSPSQPASCYRTLDSTGACIEDAEVPHDINEKMALKIYGTMVKLQTMDVIFYEAQRQGRFSFFMTSNGEEATIIGSAAALSDEDHIFSQYREHGALLYRGFSFLDMAHQCFGNLRGHGKGRQMPIHYGSKMHNFQTVSAPLATQLPHAVGAAYALKLQGQKAVTAVYFGEGAASEGDFHAALNFAATLSAPVLFICRNNGWAISTPATEQYKGDGIVGRGPSYGIPSVRVDGGDVRAVYNATAEARRIALEHTCPVLIEAMSYRSGHHSTSDDSSRYRTAEEMGLWRARDPATRFHNFIVGRGWWDADRERQLRVDSRRQVVDALTEAQKGAKPPLSELFTDVYADMPWHLREQEAEARAHAERHPDSLHGIPLE